MEYNGTKPVKQLKLIKSLGMEWAAKIRKAKFMLVRSNWKSANLQLKSKLEYGLVAVSASPKQLKKVGLDIHYAPLSPLGINQKIKKEVRLLHSKYQGANMLDLNNASFAAKTRPCQMFEGKTAPSGNYFRQPMRLSYLIQALVKMSS